MGSEHDRRRDEHTKGVTSLGYALFFQSFLRHLLSIVVITKPQPLPLFRTKYSNLRTSETEHLATRRPPSSISTATASPRHYRYGQATESANLKGHKHGAGLVTQRKRPSIHAQDKRQSYLLSECPPARRFSDTEQAHSYASAWYTSLPLFVWNSALRQELRRRPPISVHHHRPFCPDAAPSPPRPGPAPLPSQPDPYCLLTFHQNLIIIGLPGGERCWSIIEIGHRAKQVTSFETQHEYIFRIGDLSAGTKGATELGCTRMFARLNCYSLSTFSLA